MSKADGQKIAVKFTQPILSDLSTLSASSFAVTGNEYNMTPEGTLIDKTYPVLTVSEYSGLIVTLPLGGGTLTDTTFANGVLKLAALS